MQALFGIKKFCYQFNRLNRTAGVWCQLKIVTQSGTTKMKSLATAVADLQYILKGV